jgi:EamA domain-containing membrane protein RarD
MTVAGVGYFYFDEPLTRWEIIAVGLATVAAAIMAR